MPPTSETLPLGKGHTLTMSPTQGQADIIWAILAPAISLCLKARLYGWLPLSDASGIFSLLSILCLPSLASFCPWNQSIISQIGINQQCARASAAWRANNQIAQGNALGVICRVMIPPRRGKSIFRPSIMLLPCLGAACFVPCSPRVLPWAGSLLPLSGAHSAEQLLLLGVLMSGGATPGLRIRMNEDLSNNIRILTPN